MASKERYGILGKTWAHTDFKAQSRLPSDKK